MAGRAFTCVFALVLALGVAADAAAKRNIAVYGFKGGSDGSSPYGGLVMDASGNLYGTTGTGGGGGHCGGGCGTLFKLDTHGTHIVLHDFTGGDDGGAPDGDLVADSAGNIYGATILGSSSFGSLFELSSGGAFSVLHTFAQTDGSWPGNHLAIAPNGDIYGTTAAGGAHNAGTVFKLANDGTLTTLYAFRDQEDGRQPYGGVVMDVNGNLFGATQGGADPKCLCGEVFEFSHDGAFSVLHTFSGKRDGGQPLGPLLVTDAGVVGTTLYGGAKCGCGVIYRIGAGGGFTVLHAFANRKEGARPSAALIADADGNLYGTTQGGGGCKYADLGCGTVFRLASDGTLDVLHKFTGGSDGFGPVAPLVASGLNLYGVAPQGGGTGCNGHGCGMVFRVKNSSGK